LDEGWAAALDSTARRLAASGAELLPVDPAPFLEAGAMLYEGAFVAERYTAVGAFLDREPAAPDLDPTVTGIIRRTRDIPAHRLFADQARLEELRGRAMAGLGDADALLLPTAPGHPTIAAVAADPVGANVRLGRFTNSTNLFDLCAVAVPSGEVGGLPFGVMLIGPAFTDDRVARIAALLDPAPVRLAVVGAHLSGQPLNHQLTDLGGRLLTATATAPAYRLHALRTTPPKPGLVRVTDGGVPVEAEVWELPAAGLGRLLADLPRPMVLGTVELADGSWATGFLCEPEALRDAPDITSHGGWRPYLGVADRDPTGC
jgi:allophanate hydrolase